MNMGEGNSRSVYTRMDLAEGIWRNMPNATMMHGYMFNIDRWAAYTKQKLHASGKHYSNLNQYGGRWFMPTPKQRRRIKHKGNKNQDRM